MPVAGGAGAGLRVRVIDPAVCACPVRVDHDRQTWRVSAASPREGEMVAPWTTM